MYYPVVGKRTPLIFKIIITLIIHHYGTIYINLPAKFNVFGSMVAGTFQITFHVKIHVNNIFLFFKNHF